MLLTLFSESKTLLKNGTANFLMLSATRAESGRLLVTTVSIMFSFSSNKVYIFQSSRFSHNRAPRTRRANKYTKTDGGSAALTLAQPFFTQSHGSHPSRALRRRSIA
jgi:hypothetical protein